METNSMPQGEQLAQPTLAQRLAGIALSIAQGYFSGPRNARAKVALEQKAELVAQAKIFSIRVADLARDIASHLKEPEQALVVPSGADIVNGVPVIRWTIAPLALEAMRVWLLEHNRTDADALVSSAIVRNGYLLLDSGRVPSIPWR